MKFDNIKVGDVISFNINGIELRCTYVGRFDFLYLFDTDFKTLPKVTKVQNHSIAIANFNLLSRYGMNKEEIRAILYHEVGHMISTNQDKLDGIAAEYDADDYAISIVGKGAVLSALEKTKQIFEFESSSEEKKRRGIAELEKRYNVAKAKREKESTEHDQEER